MLALWFAGLMLSGAIAALVAIRSDAKGYYWLAGLLLYVACYLGSWSIGILLLVLPIICWTCAAVHSFSRTRRLFSRMPGAAVLAGVLIWLLSIWLLDDAWLFFPFRFLS